MGLKIRNKMIFFLQDHYNISMYKIVFNKIILDSISLLESSNLRILFKTFMDLTLLMELEIIRINFGHTNTDLIYTFTKIIQNSMIY